MLTPGTWSTGTRSSNIYLLTLIRGGGIASPSFLFVRGDNNPLFTNIFYILSVLYLRVLFLSFAHVILYACKYVYSMVGFMTFMHLGGHFLSEYSCRVIISVELLPDIRRHYEERGVG